MNHVGKKLVLLTVLVVVATLNLRLVVAQTKEYDIQVNPEVLEAAVDNCATIFGQAFVTSGVEENVTTDAPASGTVTPPTALFNGVSFTPSADTDNVAILVIDQFSGMNSGSLSNRYDVSGDVYTATSGTDLQPNVDDGTLSHGAQVFNHINALLQPVLSAAGYSPSFEADQVVWSDGTNRVVVKMVDAITYNIPTPTPVVSGLVAQSVLDLAADGIDHFVLNMSFAVLPCVVAEDFKNNEAQLPSLNEYTAEVQARFPSLATDLLITPRNGSADPLLMLLDSCYSQSSGKAASKVSAANVTKWRQEEEEPTLDSQIAQVDELCGSLNINHVGAAGNSKLEFPFYPAQWSSVTSVSASDGAALAGYSNFNANVGLLGGWFQLVDPNNSYNPVDVFYQGTSFAAPVESVCEALDLRSVSATACDTISPS